MPNPEARPEECRPRRRVFQICWSELFSDVQHADIIRIFQYKASPGNKSETLPDYWKR